ncbi:MAG: peptidase M19, partial [bacterium]
LERFVNRVEPVPLPSVSPRAQAIHGTSFVADLHADSLLFGRDLLERSEVGHVDLRRLQEGGVALQVFSLPTVAPAGQNIEQNESGGFDLITLAGIVQL